MKAFKYLFLRVTLLSLLVISVLSAALYQLPVDNSYVTATFLEFRSTGKTPHFHSGIDFSTFLKEGIPIKAVEEGYLRRLEIDLNDIYGYTVVLEHLDGYRTLYAHLSKFSDNAEKLANMLRDEFGSKRIVVEFLSNDVKVAKGEVIGYSGKTGEAAQAHCHFEVRSKDEKIIYDPLDFLDKGALKPVQMQIILKRIVVDGVEYDYVENANYKFKGSYPKIAVETYTELAKNLLGVKEIKMYFSGNLVYHIILDRLPMEYWEKPYNLYNEKTLMTAIIYRGYYNLYAEDSLPFVKVNSIDKYSSSTYSVQLEVSDGFGNSRKFSFNLVRG
ncbi:M23 family metallopeptidase [Fervidobacterium sp.]